MRFSSTAYLTRVRMHATGSLQTSTAISLFKAQAYLNSSGISFGRLNTLQASLACCYGLALLRKLINSKANLICDGANRAHLLHCERPGRNAVAHVVSHLTRKVHRFCWSSFQDLSSRLSYTVPVGYHEISRYAVERGTKRCKERRKPTE